MRPPISDLAKKLLTNKAATRQLKDILSGKIDDRKITYFDEDSRKNVAVEVTSR